MKAYRSLWRNNSICPFWQVDCAYYSDDLQEVSLDPGKELKDLLKSRGMSNLAGSCPECFENLKKLVSTLLHVCAVSLFISSQW